MRLIIYIQVIINMFTSNKACLLNGGRGAGTTLPINFHISIPVFRTNTKKLNMTKCQQARHHDLAPDTAIPGLTDKSGESRINGHLSETRSMQPRGPMSLWEATGTNRHSRHAR